MPDDLTLKKDPLIEVLLRSSLPLFSLFKPAERVLSEEDSAYSILRGVTARQAVPSRRVFTICGCVCESAERKCVK